MIKKLGFVALIVAVLVSCFNPPEYPNTPSIDFAGISFVDVPSSSDADTLVLSLNFTDGDGDLGLRANEIGNGAFVERYYFRVNDRNRYFTDNPLLVAQDINAVRFRTRSKVTGYDTLPDFVEPFTCTNWEEVFDEVGGVNTVVDTLYFQLNPNHYNIFVDFLIKQNDGSFQEYDFREELCTTYDGRIPELSTGVGQETPLEGTIRYAMPGTGFKVVFGSRTIKLRVQIQDRALNRSNILETPEFSLDEI